MSGVWIVPAGWLRARPPNGRQAIRVGCCEVGWCLRGWFLCCLPLSEGTRPLAVSLHPAPSNGRGRTTKHPPCSTEPFIGRVAHGEVQSSRTQRMPWTGAHVPVPRGALRYNVRRPLSPLGPPRRRGVTRDVLEECYLVDPASSHMLVSKIKPCMCKYELIQTVKLRMAH